MPRFFNRIRKQLAKDNKFLQYSRYAIGEILLVVIGILIAFQIDNWNENRKIRGLEIKLLNELRSDLEQTYLDIESDRKGFRISISANKAILKAIQEKIPFEDSLTTHFTKLFPHWATFSVNQATYDNIWQTGSNLISNDSLRINVSDFYRGYVNLYRELEERVVQDHYENSVKPLYLDAFIYQDRDKIYPRNYEVFMSTPQNEELLRYNVLRLEEVERVQSAMLTRIKKIIDQINSEIAYQDLRS